MQRLLHLMLLLGLLGGLGGCVDRYQPDAPEAKRSYLVVNGFINARGVTSVLLSRSLALGATGTPPPETGATLSIVGSDGQQFSLTESPAGTYTSAYLSLDPTLTYQLHIGTRDGQQYSTDAQAVKIAPPIDDLSWHYENDGVQLYTSAHDETGKSVYYRYQYKQTWQFTSRYQARYQYNKDTQLIERATQDIYHCWHTENSTAVVQTNTTRLSKDQVTDFPLVFIAPTSPKIYIRYSLLLRLFTQSQQENDYWEALRKNTELSGTVNDPLPTQLTGNVRCLTDPTEAVLGFVGVHGVSSQRIFIARDDVPYPIDRKFDLGYGKCPLIIDDRCPRGDKCLPPGVTGLFYTPNFLIVATNCDTIGHCSYLTAGKYYGAEAECVDCRLHGTNVKPDFW